MSSNDGLSENGRKVLALAQAALPTAQIAERVDLTPEEVRGELEALLSNRHPGITGEAALELERMDTLIRAIWVKAVAGEPSAVSSVTSLMARRKKLLHEAETRESRKTPAAQLTGSLQQLLDKTLSRCNDIEFADDIPGEDTNPTKE